MEYTKFVEQLPLSTDSLYAMFKSNIFDSTLESELSGFQKEVEQHVGLIHDYFAKYEWLPMKVNSTSDLVNILWNFIISLPNCVRKNF